MALSFNPSKKFEESARKTQIPWGIKYPKNTRQSLFIYESFKDGIFEIEDKPGIHVFDRCYVFSDVNYVNKDDDEKIDILTNLMKWLNYMSTDFKITVANEYKDMQDFVGQIFNDDNAEKYPTINDGVHSWINDKLESSDIRNLNKVYYLTVTVRTYSYDEARSYFLGMDVELEHFFQAFKSTIIPLNGTQRLNIIHRFCYLDDRKDNYSFSVDDAVLDVAPVSVEAGEKNFLIINDMYVSVLFARQFDSSLNEQKVIYRLSHVPYRSFCTIDYAPVDDTVLKDKLKDASLNNERSISSEIDSKRHKGQLMAGVSYQKQRKKEELEEYQEQIDENNERCLLVGLLVVVSADSEDELAKRVKSMINVGREVGVTLDTYNWVQLKAFNTALPTGVRAVEKMRAFLTSSLTALQPFHAQNLCEEGGFFYGVNDTTKELVFANRKKLTTPHGMIVGHTGSGKSYFIKETEVAQTLLSTDDDLQILDPQNEFEGVCAAFGGVFLDLTPKSEININPFEIPVSLMESKDKKQIENFIAGVTEWFVSFCQSSMVNIVYTQQFNTFLGKAVRAVYENAFDKKNTQPTLIDVHNVIGQMEKEAENVADKSILHIIYGSLEEYTTGMYDLFAHKSNVDISKERFVVFGLANVSERLWEPVMITVMFYLTNRMEYNQKFQRATRFIIDETQVVTKNKSSADMLLRAVVTYRKFGGMVTMALQNLTRALDIPDLRDMFSNCGYKCFFDSGGIDARSLASVQELSETEFKKLSGADRGNGVMVWGNKVVLLDATMNSDNPLYQIFNTDFHEKAMLGGE